MAYYPDQFWADWEKGKEINFVVGWITHDGAIFASASKDNTMHSVESKHSNTWRWAVRTQCFCEHTKWTLTPEQKQEVLWWLEKEGWKNQDD